MAVGVHVGYGRRAPLLEIEWGVADHHGDPLYISDDHRYPRPGWLFLVVYGPQITHGDIEIQYTMGMDRFYCEHWQIPLAVGIINETVMLHTTSSSIYFHPSDEWVEEVARQLVSGERMVIRCGPVRGGLHHEEYPDEPLTVCRVELRRCGDDFDNNRYDNTLVKELRTSNCLFCPEGSP